MAYDFRANQIRLNKIISSGSVPIYIYASSSATDFQGGTNFSTSGIGTDVFLFVSGSSNAVTLFGGNVVTSGSVRSLAGLTGSLRYVDASNNPLVVAGPDISVNYNSLGQWEISGSEAGYFSSPSNNVVNTTGSLEATYLSASTGAEITGSLKVNGGITGSLSGTLIGNPFIIAGPNVITNYNSLGQWEITGSGGGGNDFFFSNTLNIIEASGSLYLSGNLQSSFLSASNGATITGSLIQGSGGIASGTDSHAEGSGTTASGQYAHAEGQSTTASGQASHAEGVSTTASALYSHAEGNATQATDDGAHAEGRETVASGQYSHAAGYQTTAAGDYSYAGGNNIEAFANYQTAVGTFNIQSNGNSLFVVGDGTDAFNRHDILRANVGIVEITGSLTNGNLVNAIGNYSHAEGVLTNATAFYAHAEGWQTVASGLASHAEGYQTTAEGQYSHAIGYLAKASGTGSLAAGLGTIASGAIDGVSPPITSQAAFGKYNLDSNTDSLFVVGDGFDASNRHDVLRVNSGSVQITGSLEVDGAATITGSFILTSSVPARIITSVRLGGTNVSANGLYAFGQGTAINAGGDYAFAQGNSAIASGQASHAQGATVQATGVASHAEGNGTTASGNNSHAEGYQTTSSGPASHSEGGATTASNDYSHAEGQSTTASGQASHSEGYSTLASGPNSHSEGYQTTAGTISAGNAHSEGAFTVASGDSAHAEGSTTTASGVASHSEGYNTKSRGNYSHAQGWGSEAYGAGTLAAGLFTVASGSGPTDNPPTTSQASFGKYNLENNTDSLLVVGDGLDASNRHDVLRVNSGSVQITGSLAVDGGITGSLSGTVAGNPFIVAGSNITANYNTLGQWEITGSGGGGGTNFFTEIGLNSIQTTGSVTISQNLTASNLELTGNPGVISNVVGPLLITSSLGITTSGSIIISGSRSDLGTEQTSVLINGDLFVSGGMGLNDYIQLKPVGTLRIPTNITSSYIYTSGSTNDLYFTQYSGPYTNTTRLRWIESSLVSGLLHGGILTTVNGTTTFSVTSGSGIIVSQNATATTDAFPTIQKVDWPAYISQSLTYVSSAQLTYIGINPANSQIIQRTTPFADGDFEEYIVLGRILHQSGSVTNGASTSPKVSYATSTSYEQFIRSFGPLKISGHVLAASGSTLGLTKTGGDSYVKGRNYTVDPSDPDYIKSTSDYALTTSKIFREYVTGSGYLVDTGIANAGYTTIDPTKYNNNGTLASVTGGKFTIQRVYWFPNAVTRALYVYYGNATYNSLDLAEAAIKTENFTEGANTSDAAILVAYLLVAGNATNLSNTTEARFVQAGTFRAIAGVGGGGAGGSTTPGGLDTYVQFNDGGSTFGGDADFTFNKTTNTLSIQNINATGLSVSTEAQITGSLNITGSVSATTDVFKINGFNIVPLWNHATTSQAVPNTLLSGSILADNMPANGIGLFDMNVIATDNSAINFGSWKMVVTMTASSNVVSVAGVAELDNVLVGTDAASWDVVVNGSNVEVTGSLSGAGSVHWMAKLTNKMILSSSGQIIY